MKEFFTTLFNSGEGICTGDAFATEVSLRPKSAEFFSVNPLDSLRDHGFFLKESYEEYVPRRADLNVTKFRNLIFEMDSLQLQDQLNIFKNCDIPFTSIVYSGGKSYHAILSVEEGVCGGCHTIDGLDKYKNIWRRIAAKIDKVAKLMGYDYPDGKPSFVDHSCKNPSRLTRYPDYIRSNGNMQELIQLTERMNQEDFQKLLETCPNVYTSNRTEFSIPVKEIDTLEQFQSACPPDLMVKLKIVDWAGSEGMYPYLFRWTTWAIDSTNVSKEAFIEFLEKYTFKSLINRGYPAHRLITAIDHAYSMKGR